METIITLYFVLLIFGIFCGFMDWFCDDLLPLIVDFIFYIIEKIKRKDS